MTTEPGYSNSSMSSEVIPGYHPAEDYRVGQKVHSGFSVTSYGKTRTNFLINPIHRALSKEPLSCRRDLLQEQEKSRG